MMPSKHFCQASNTPDPEFAMLWGAAQRAGVRYLISEDLRDGFELAGVRFPADRQKTIGEA
jgi:hypothetical protein